MTSIKNQLIFVAFLLCAIVIVIDANYVARNQYGYGNRVPSRNNVTHYGGFKTNRTNSFGNWPPAPASGYRTSQNSFGNWPPHSSRFNNTAGVRNYNVRNSFGNWASAPITGYRTNQNSFGNRPPYGRFNNTVYTSGVRNSNVPKWNQTISRPQYQSGSQGGYPQIYNGGFNQRNATYGSPYRRPFNYTNSYRRF